MVSKGEGHEITEECRVTLGQMGRIGSRFLGGFNENWSYHKFTG